MFNLHRASANQSSSSAILGERRCESRSRKLFNSGSSRSGLFGGEGMRKVLPICMFAIFVLAIAGIRGACAQEQTNLPLHLLQTISIPGMKGRLDHLDVDVQGQRLFVSGLENGSVEALDLQAGKWLRRIPGFQ